MIGGEPHLPYDRPPLSKAFLERIESHDTQAGVQFRTEQTLDDELVVELVLGEPASALDTRSKVIALGRRSWSRVGR